MILNQEFFIQGDEKDGNEEGDDGSGDAARLHYKQANDDER